MLNINFFVKIKLDFESLTEKTFGQMQEICDKTLQSITIDKLFKGTDRYHVSSDKQLPGGLIIVDESSFELLYSNFKLAESDSDTEVLALFLAFAKIFGIKIINAGKILKKLIEI